ARAWRMLYAYAPRVCLKPTERWEFQASRGHLTEPEELESGDLVRTTLSASWTKEADGAMASVTAAGAHNDTAHGSRSAFLVEAARRRGPHTLYTRLESLQL